MDKTNKIKILEKKLYKHLKDRDWHLLRPVDLSKSIMIEGAELLEIFQWENLSLEEIKKDKEKIAQIKEELADVLIYAMELSVLLDLDTEKIINTKLRAVQKKYPAKLMKKSSSKGGSSDSEYWRIKKEYRLNKNKA
ncbi:MAG: nucleotide pyrophosphohydrolase [Candidatus Pacebacteria bacterium]|nr:nucleotide pyrophosphohydrolase [Candidatus Paceibacterota bacterium]MBP9715715.1 nucleotide pyrophosphohydrolase [Candidatus Paceibacterota bacterium]